MRSKLLCASLLALCTSLAQAAPSEWAFTYTGFYSEEQGAFLSDWTLSGTFSGDDLNHNGVLERGELTSLMVGYMDYATCGNTEYSACGTENFAFRLPGSTLRSAMSVPTASAPLLTFSLNFSAHDPEWYVGSGRQITTGVTDYSYSRDPGSFVENTYSWRNETALSVGEVAIVPEPSSWAMLAAGAAVLMLAARPRRRVQVWRA